MLSSNCETLESKSFLAWNYCCDSLWYHHMISNCSSEKSYIGHVSTEAWYQSCHAFFYSAKNRTLIKPVFASSNSTFRRIRSSSDCESCGHCETTPASDADVRARARSRPSSAKLSMPISLSSGRTGRILREVDDTKPRSLWDVRRDEGWKALANNAAEAKNWNENFRSMVEK